MQLQKVRKVHCVIGLDYNVEYVPSISHSRGIPIFFRETLAEIDFLVVNRQCLMGLVRMQGTHYWVFAAVYISNNDDECGFVEYLGEGLQSEYPGHDHQ